MPFQHKLVRLGKLVATNCLPQPPWNFQEGHAPFQHKPVGFGRSGSRIPCPSGISRLGDPSGISRLGLGAAVVAFPALPA